jgi:triphosphoribosyl-dephospho-CoA synthetase
MNCSALSELEALAAALARGASLELYLTPKPGLVDLADCGAHPDLSIRTMERSIRRVADYLQATVASLGAGHPFAAQRAIGLAAERRLLDELGTNTHKGFIFLSGILLVARWRAASADEGPLRAALCALAGEFFAAGDAPSTNGGQARQKYRAGGIVAEATRGFPSVFEQGLPVFRQAMQRQGCCAAASFALLARLMQTVEDTTTLHRAGAPGLARVKRDGRRLERMVAAGGDYRAYLRALNRHYVRLNITIGGVADMLGISYGCLLAGGEISPAGAASLGAGRADWPR